MPGRSVYLAAVLILVVALSPGCGEKKAAEEDAGDKAAQAPVPAQPPAPEPLPPVPPETVRVTVDGTDITQGDVEEALASRVPAEMRKTRTPQIVAFEQQIEDQLVMRHLVENAIEAEGIEPSAEAVAARWKEAVTDRLPEGETEATFLERSDVTKAEAESQVRMAIAFDMLMERHREGVVPTDEAVRAHYDANIMRFQEPETVSARHILIMTDKDESAEARAKKRAQLEDIRKKLVASDDPADFAALAEAHSSCPSGKEAGGSLDFFRRGQMVPEFEKTAFALDPGQISDVFETQFGYHILRVDEKRSARTVPYEEVAEEIRRQLAQEARREADRSFLDELRAKAKIERPPAGDRSRPPQAR